MDWRSPLVRPAASAHFRFEVRPLLQDLLLPAPERRNWHCEIPLIISNHPDNQRIADFYRIPYFRSYRSRKRTRPKRNRSNSRLVANTNQSRRTCPLHASAFETSSLRPWFGELMQYPSLFFARVRWVEALPQGRFSAGVKLIGATATLRHTSARRWPLHRTGRCPHLPPRHDRRSRTEGPRYREGRAVAGRALARGNRSFYTAIRPSSFNSPHWETESAFSVTR